MAAFVSAVYSALLILTTALLTTTVLLLPTRVLAEDTSGFQQFGGQPIPESSYRFYTALTTRTGSFRCSGVLIGRRFVATAAHCVSGSIDTTFVDVGYYCVRRDNCGRPHEVIAIESVARIPGGQGDFAILTLVKGPSTRPKIRPIIPDLGGKILKKLDPDAEMKLVGGGRSAEGSGPSEFVEELTVRYIPLKQCKKSGLTRDLFGMICSEPVGGSRAGPCEGDSGGPVIVTRKGVEYLVAVHSFGKRVCGSERVKPDGHATVKSATKLIQSVICNGAYPEDWCEKQKKKKKKKNKDEPAQEPSEEEASGKEPSGGDMESPTSERTTRSPAGDVVFVTSPTFEPTTEPTKEPTPEEDSFLFEPSNGALVDDGGPASTTYLISWETRVSDFCAVRDELTLRCTGEGATIQFVTYQGFNGESVFCVPSQNVMTCQGSVLGSTFAVVVQFVCTAPSANGLTAEGIMPATTASCFQNTGGDNSVFRGLQLAAFCGETTVNFGGMECANEGAFVVVEGNPVCVLSDQCPTTSSCSLVLVDMTVRYSEKPPNNCIDKFL